MSKNFVLGLPEALVPTGPVRGRWIILGERNYLIVKFLPVAFVRCSSASASPP